MKIQKKLLVPKQTVESTDDLEDWMMRDNKTNNQLVYWILEYILMRGTKSMSDMGCISPQMASLAKSKDAIG